VNSGHVSADVVNPDLANADLASLVEAWIADDPDDETAAELAGVLDAMRAGDAPALADAEDRFSGMLQFGTAGLRGALGAGPNRMNRAVVIRAAAGLAAYMIDALGGPGTVAIGYDARFKSDRFAVDTAAVMTAAGHRALLLPSALPTPVLAYAVRELAADAGVMVTASHNPPEDNGYKVYLGGRIVGGGGQGAQIVPPFDAEIASRIARVESVAAVPRAESGWTVIGDDLLAKYIAATAALVGEPSPATRADRAAVTIVLTPLHGVGGATLDAVLRAAGFTDLHVVAEQAQPDPSFPTVAFPNPEEKGAMDLTLAFAEKVGADVAIANDPDADRCAVAAVIDGRWTTLHGDRVGALLGERLARQAAAAGRSGTLANSIVSSRILARIAERHGFAYESTLTGFKWIGRTEGLIFGYEEALGYCVAPDLVRDKDGISAAVVIADLVAELAAAGHTLEDELESLDREYGVYLTRQVSARLDSVEASGAAVAAILANSPTALGGSAVTVTEDMSLRIDGLLSTPGLRVTTAIGARVIIRPSGTEAKVKVYLEVIEPVADSVFDARAAAERLMAELESDVRAALGLSRAGL
jgi:phosphomannomutase